MGLLISSRTSALHAQHLLDVEGKSRMVGSAVPLLVHVYWCVLLPFSTGSMHTDGLA